MSEEIVTLTMNPAVDISTHAEKVEPTRKVRCHSVRRDPGGGGINVARVVCRLGGAATAIYTSGGHSGRVLTALLEDESIAADPLPVSDATRVTFSVLEQSTNSRFRFVLPGPVLSEETWRSCLDRLARKAPAPGYLVASGSLPPGVPDDFYGRMAVVAKKHDIRFVLDTSGEALAAGISEGVYAVKPNRRELEQVTGGPLDTATDQEQASRDLVARGKAELVALTLGEDGALLASRNGTERCGTPEVSTRSSIGAGDSFLAALILALAGGRAHREALRYAVAAGTAALLTPGTELCRRDDVVRLAQQLSDRDSRS